MHVPRFLWLNSSCVRQICHNISTLWFSKTDLLKFMFIKMNEQFKWKFYTYKRFSPSSIYSFKNEITSKNTSRRLDMQKEIQIKRDQEVYRIATYILHFYRVYEEMYCKTMTTLGQMERVWVILSMHVSLCNCQGTSCGIIDINKQHARGSYIAWKIASA
jgi:hypothetical protein